MSVPNSAPPLLGYLPNQTARTYSPVGHCIYCGSMEKLSDEHIVPLGLGGRLVLPKASCPECNERTSRLERTCLRTMYGPLRMMYGLPTRRKSSRPDSLQLKVKRTETSEWEYIAVPQERYPFLITFPYFEAPGALTALSESVAAGPVAQRFWIRGASPQYNFSELCQSLTEELGIYSLMPESKADVSAFCSLLAKIALAYTVAENRVVAHGTKLANIALGADMQHCRHYIGSLRQDEPATDLLHELSIGDHTRESSILVRLRLLAKLGTPTYFVVVPQ